MRILYPRFVKKLNLRSIVALSEVHYRLEQWQDVHRLYKMWLKQPKNVQSALDPKFPYLTLFRAYTNDILWYRTPVF